MVNDWATFCPFCCNLQSIFTKFKHTQVTPCGKRHTPLFLISIFLLVAGSCWGIFFSPPSNFVIYKIWIFSLQNLAKLVKFALGKKKISEISESFGWNNNNFCLGKKKQLSCQLQNVTILQQPTNFKEAVHQFEVFLLSSQFGVM